MIAVFGPRAGRFAQGLRVVENAIITDPASLGKAYVAAVKLRETATPFYGQLLFEDTRSRVIFQCMASIRAQIDDLDARRSVAEQLCAGKIKMPDGTPAGDFWDKPDPPYHQTLGEFAALSDALLVRSTAEFLRISALLKRPRRYEVVVVEPQLPPIERVQPKRPGVVLWAPDYTSDYVSLFALSLLEFLGDVTFVTSDGVSLPEYPTINFVQPGSLASNALGRATCVVCADCDDPGAAVAFARHGFGVVAPLSSGAHEFVRDMAPFDMGNFRSILTAVQIAVAQPASIRALPVPPAVPARPPLPPLALRPLVSAIVPTYNRREDLVRALTSLSQQTYANVEILVVNDCGADVSDIVATFPRARLHTMAQNGGVLLAIAEGLRHVTGEYVQLLADDDWLMPDHIEGLAGALMRTGGTIAHSNTMIRYQDLVPGKEPITTGFNTVVFNETTTPTDAMIATPISGNSLFFRRDMFATIGPWNETCFLADQELQMRAANAFVMVYVDRVSAEWRVRGTDNFSTKTDSTAELRRVYEEMHPTPDRPYLEMRRAETLENVARRTVGVFAFPPSMVVQRS
jgi:GT2 family glycosyltransferase